MSNHGPECAADISAARCQCIAVVPVSLIEECLRLRNIDGTQKVPAEARNIIRAAMDAYLGTRP